MRWGQNGIAVSAIPSSFTSNNQIYIFQSSLVKDVSSSPADLSVSLTGPSTATTGTAVSYAAKVTNNGPNPAVGTSLSVSLSPSLIVSSVSASQGTCTTAATFICDLSGLANGASATVTVSAIPTSSGTLASMASVSSSSYDPTASNNQATGSTTVTGSLYGAVPSISSISPNLVQGGAAAFTLTVNGTGFNASSTVNLGSTALVTTYVSSTQITAAVTAAAIATALAYLPSEDFMARLNDLLSVMLYLFTPWTAINLVDFYLIRKGHYSVREIFNRIGMYGDWNWRGLSAYFGGFIAMVPFFSTGLYTGPVARALNGADIAMVVGLPVSSLIYIWACRSMDLVEDRRLAEQADNGLA